MLGIYCSNLLTDLKKDADHRCWWSSQYLSQYNFSETGKSQPLCVSFLSTKTNFLIDGYGFAPMKIRFVQLFRDLEKTKLRNCKFWY